jgi:hypothetical protein
VTKSIAIYVEGGGDTAETLTPFRTGMSSFLKPVVDVVREKRILWRVIPCGGRKQAYDAFVDALEKEPEVFNVLLVDSEEPVALAVPPWDHLGKREGDKWGKPVGADDTRCQMMVACMEAWFLADPAGLKDHFRKNFDIGKLPPTHQAETHTKSKINDVLQKATKLTAAKEYRKIRDGAKLLKKVNPAEVRKHCQWCERLFRALGDVIGASI